MNIEVYNVALSALLSHVGLKSFDDQEIVDIKRLFESSARFISSISHAFPVDFKKHNVSSDLDVESLVSGMSEPENACQSILSLAWKTAIGIPDQDNLDTHWYKRQNLLPLFETISIECKKEGAEKRKQEFIYPLKPISPENVFPEKIANNPSVIPTALGDLLAELKSHIENMDDRQDISIWFEHLDNLMMRWTSHIPTVLPKGERIDISVYDHAKIASAISTALYLFYTSKGLLEKGSGIRSEDKSLHVISGDFFGIQNFIFNGYGDSGKFRSKIMRGRSFFVSLLSELSASMICEELGLPVTSILINAAGKFVVLAPNSDDVPEALRRIEKTINTWLVKVAYGETLFGISSVEASCDDLIPGRFLSLIDQMDAVSERKKYAPLSVMNYNPIHDDYLSRFQNTMEPPVCWLCHKRPSEKTIKDYFPGNEIYEDQTAENKAICPICRDQIFIGTHIVKHSNSIKNNSLCEKIFGRYQMEFSEGKILIKTENGKIFKSWHIDPSDQSEITSTIKYISGYVPVHDEDQDEMELVRCLSDNDSFMNEIRPGNPKTFNYIASMAQYIEPSPGKNIVKGTDALGVLKADVDHLGLIMSCGIPDKENNLSRMTGFSRLMNMFFTLFLPDFLRRHFKNIYTVFAGGDDLFVIGPWNEIIDLSIELKNHFERYVCHNPDIHFSAGITLHKSGAPVETIAHTAEKALEYSKNISPEKNKFTLFARTEDWNRLTALQTIRDTFRSWFDSNILNKAMLYRLNSLIRFVEQEKKLLKRSKTSIPLKDMDCTRWRYLLAYSVERNVKPEEKSELTKEKVKEQLTAWLDEHEGAMRIPLWQVLYELR